MFQAFFPPCLEDRSEGPLERGRLKYPTSAEALFDQGQVMDQPRSERIASSLKGSLTYAGEAKRLLLQGKALSEVEVIIWEAYSRVEYAIFLIKLGAESEFRPNRGPSKPAEPAVSVSVTQTEEELDVALHAYQANDSSRALSSARGARDRLRSLLAEARKARKKLLLGSPRP